MFWRLFLAYTALFLTCLGALGIALVQHTDDPKQLAFVRRIVWTAAGVTVAGTLVLSAWLAWRRDHPLHELKEGAERIAAGDYGHKIYAAGVDETAGLARAFNYMSERLAAQFSQLEEDRQQLRAVLDAMVEGVVAVDAGQRILFTNDRAAQFLGFDARVAVGRKFWELVRHRSLTDLVTRALATADACAQEVHWDGPTSRCFAVHAARLAAGAGGGAVLVLHDTTELRRLERVRQEFVANVSHELKTPLSVITACVETLLDSAAEDPEQRGAFLQQIADQAERLHALILDLISLARIEAQAETFEFQEISLRDLVADCLQRYRTRAEADHQVLEAVPSINDEESPGKALAWGDIEAVNQILDNLVDNALKYTPARGRIQLGWGLADGGAYLEVRDTGIGIPKRDLPRIFERFYRVDKARSRELGGTGLGLSIVKHLVQAMGGKVTVQSRLGEGTTFHVRLPTGVDKS